MRSSLETLITSEKFPTQNFYTRSYFTMEMVLSFNLGPLHLLGTLIDDIIRKPVDFNQKII